MSLATIYSRALSGMQALPVRVEVFLSFGTPRTDIVGLPETAVKESRNRVRAALTSNHFRYPNTTVTINLSPADLPKDGGRYDLPIALGILVASGQLPQSKLRDCEVIGELSLTGRLLPVRGVLPIALAVLHSRRQLLLPAENVAEASLVTDIPLIAAKHISQICAHLGGSAVIEPCIGGGNDRKRTHSPVVDLGEVHGQTHAKRALLIAAAGRHNLLMIGPPGSGKTMLAERLPAILPPMSDQEALETAILHSLSRQGFDLGTWRRRPFRSPHHTASQVALVGGGGRPRPGEISLAHHGVLFLDELPEYSRHVLEVLREPLESGRITISRAQAQVEYPACFQLVAAMNPCPCGYHGDTHRNCCCTVEQIQRYRRKISGPIIDRIDMIIEIPNIAMTVLSSQQKPLIAENEAACKQVQACIARQHSRRAKCNSKLTRQQLQQDCHLDQTSLALLKDAVEQMGLTARSVHRIMRVARTIADLDDIDAVEQKHVFEAIGYRRFAATLW